MTQVNEAKYLLFAPEKEGTEELLKELNYVRVGKVDQAKTLDETRISISTGKYRCLLLNLRTFRSQDVQVIHMLCSLRKNLSVVTIARIVDEDAYKQIKDQRNIILLQRPFQEAKIIALFARKISMGQDSYRREHWRYPTQQQAGIELLSNHKNYKGSITNISRGGAMFECAENLDIMEREFVTLQIQLNELGKVHVLRAEVAWYAGYDKKMMKSSVGLKFIDPAEFSETVYTKLKG